MSYARASARVAARRGCSRRVVRRPALSARRASISRGRGRARGVGAPASTGRAARGVERNRSRPRRGPAAARRRGATRLAPGRADHGHLRTHRDDRHPVVPEVPPAAGAQRYERRRRRRKGLLGMAHVSISHPARGRDARGLARGSGVAATTRARRPSTRRPRAPARLVLPRPLDGRPPPRPRHPRHALLARSEQPGRAGLSARGGRRDAVGGRRRDPARLRPLPHGGYPARRLRARGSDDGRRHHRLRAARARAHAWRRASRSRWTSSASSRGSAPST